MIAVTDQLLDILKYALLALLYLFFARVLWAVWSEVRGPRQGKARAAQVPVTEQSYGADRAGHRADGLHDRDGRRPPRGRHRRAGGRRRRPRSRSSSSPSHGCAAARCSSSVRRSPSAGPTSCTVTIPDDSFVSQLHARVYLLQGAAVAEDLGSTNGTYLNGKRLTAPTQIIKGDRLQVGNTIFEAQ